MPKKHKKPKRVIGIPHKALGLSDKYLFRRTYLDTEMIDKLTGWTQGLTNNGTLPLEGTQTTFITEMANRLQNFEFNNIYDYLEELITGIRGDSELTKAITADLEEYFGAECTRLANLYVDSECFDM